MKNLYSQIFSYSVFGLLLFILFLCFSFPAFSQKGNDSYYDSEIRKCEEQNKNLEIQLLEKEKQMQLNKIAQHSKEMRSDIIQLPFVLICVFEFLVILVLIIVFSVLLYKRGKTIRELRIGNREI